jgi:hypothetical protein
MTKDKTYYFHQTPPKLCKDIMGLFEWKDGEKVLEPFKGEGGFYNNLPDNIEKHYTEIEEGMDFKDFDYENIKIDTVISNPPFKLINNEGKVYNGYNEILTFYANKPEISRIIFLVNDACFNSATINRIKKLNELNLYIIRIITCDIKAWRGRYYIIEYGRNPNNSFHFLDYKY